MNEKGKMNNPTGQNAQQGQGGAGEVRPEGSGGSAAQAARHSYNDNDPKCEPSKENPKPTIEDKLEEMKKEKQAAQVESELDKQLFDCLEKKNGELSKLHDEIETIMKDYTNEKDGYEYLKKTLDCMRDNNKNRLGTIPTTASKNIKEVIRKKDAKICWLKKCKEKFECLCDIKTVATNPENMKDPCTQVKVCNDEAYCCDDKKPECLPSCDPDKLSDKTAEQFDKIKSKKQADDDLEKSKKHYKLEIKEFEKLKKLKATIIEDINKMEEYQTIINAACNDYSICKMYTYILLIQEILDKPELECLKTPDDMLKALVDALDQLKCAKNDLCYKEYVINKVSKTLETLKNDLNDAEKNRENDILEQISRISN